MTMIAPMPETPAAPTPWQVGPGDPAVVQDANGNFLFIVDGDRLTDDRDEALARELVDLVNRVTDEAADSGLPPVTGQAADTPDVELPAVVETCSRLRTFRVRRSRVSGYAEVRVCRGDSTEVNVAFGPAAARRLAYALLAAAGPEADETPEIGDRVRVVECCPGNGTRSCQYIAGQTGTLVSEYDPDGRCYQVRMDDSAVVETVHKVVKITD